MAAKKDEDDMEESLESFFLDEEYVMRSFELGPYSISLLSLQSSSTDYDLTGQILWPGTELLNAYILNSIAMFKGASVIELGSGAGLTGLLCAHICSHVVMTDHNDTVLKLMKQNVQLLQQNSPISSANSIYCKKLEWGNEEQVKEICECHHHGFDFILGADICYQQSNLKPLLSTVAYLLEHSLAHRTSKFLLAYVSRIKSTDELLLLEASRHNLQVNEVCSTRAKVGGIYEGIVYEILLQVKKCAAMAS